MRLIWMLVVISALGCKTAEFAVDHSMTGIHVAAKFEAKDEVEQDLCGPSLISAQ